MRTNRCTGARGLSVAVLLLTAGCGGGSATESGSAGGSSESGATSPSASGSGDSTTSTDTGSASTGSPGSVAGIELPVEVTYAGLTWALTDLTREVDEDGDGRFVADLRVENPTGQGSRWPAGVLSMRSEDGDVIDAERVVNGPIEVREGETVNVQVEFEQDDDPDPADLSFVVAETDRVPAAIPLVGEPPDNPYPLEPAFEGTTPLVGGLGGRVSVSAVDAEIAVDAPGERALTGHRLAVLDVELSVPATSTNNYLRDGFALEIDGVRREPREVIGNDVVERGTSRPVTVLADVPREAEDLALVILSNQGEQIERLPVRFDPPLPPCCGE